MGLAPTLLGQNNIRLTNKYYHLNYKYNQVQQLMNRYKAISNQSTPIFPTTKNHNKNLRKPYPMSSQSYNYYNYPTTRTGILKKPRSSSKHLTHIQANSNSNLHKLRLTLPSTSSAANYNFSGGHKMLMRQQHSQHEMSRHTQITMKNNLKCLRKSYPAISNMPFINFNSSLILVNSSPFALSDPRFGIFHHDSPSLPYL